MKLPFPFWLVARKKDTVMHFAFLGHGFVTWTFPCDKSSIFSSFFHILKPLFYTSNEKNPSCLGFYLGWNPTQFYGNFQSTIIPIKQPVPSLKLTANAPEIGPSQKDMSSSKASIFRGEPLVAGRVYMDVSLNSGSSPWGVSLFLETPKKLENCGCFFYPPVAPGWFF